MSEAAAMLTETSVKDQSHSPPRSSSASRGYGAESTTATYQEGIRSFFEKRKPVFQGK